MSRVGPIPRPSQLLETIPRILRVVDFGVKWKQLAAGEVLVTEGAPSNGCLYVLLYGRARSSLTEGGEAGRCLTDSEGGCEEGPGLGSRRTWETIVCPKRAGCVGASL